MTYATFLSFYFSCKCVVGVRVHVLRVCKHTHPGQEVTSVISSNDCVPCLLKQSLPWTQSLLTQLMDLVRLLPGSHLCPLCSEIVDELPWVPSIYVGARDLSVVPHACTPCPLPADTTPLSLILPFYWVIQPEG